MIRRIYIDFILERMRRGDFGWLFSRVKQYLLTHASAAIGRPLCSPILGTVVTNYYCNYRCLMCDLPLRDKELRKQGLSELDTKGMQLLIRKFKSLGVSGIGFTGGEPLLRNDIMELLSFTKGLGLITHLNTNGSLLDDAMVEKILGARVDSINISLDGAHRETHDRIRGVAGAYDRAIAGIERTIALRDRAGVRLRVKTVAVVQEENLDEMNQLIALAKDLKVDCIELIPHQPFRSAEEKDSPANPEIIKKVTALTDMLLAGSHAGIAIENSKRHLRLFRGSFLKQPSPVRCYAGYNSLAVDCFGQIYPCVPWFNWRKTVGTIEKRGLVDFWYSKEYNAVRKEIALCRKCTLNCQTELNILFDLGSILLR